MAVKIVFLGPAGSGKGTQCQKLAERSGIRHISTGDVFRAERAKGTPLGKEVGAFMDRGELVPTPLAHRSLAETMASLPEGVGWALDGFPREPDNARFLVEAGLLPDVIVELIVPEDVLVTRLATRVVDSRTGKVYNLATNPPPPDAEAKARPDDSEKASVLRRIQIYKDNVSACLDALGTFNRARLLTQVDGTGDVEMVHRCIWRIIEPFVNSVRPVPLVVGFQAGRSEGEAIDYLIELGFSRPLRPLDGGSRCLTFQVGRAPAFLGARDVKYVPVKPRDAARRLLGGTVDVAMDDNMYHLERKFYQLKPLRLLKEFDTPHRPHLAVVGRPTTQLDNPANRIIAEYEDAERVLRLAGVRGSVEQGSGGSEGLVTAGLYDLALVVVETGSTLIANNLVELYRFRDIRLGIWANTETPEGLRAFLVSRGCESGIVNVGGPLPDDTRYVVDLLNQRKELWDFAFVRLPARPPPPPVVGSVFVLQHPLHPDAAAWNGVSNATVFDSAEGRAAAASFITSRLLGQEVADSGARPAFWFPDVMDPDTLSDEAFSALPLVIKGESKEVRYVGKGQVMIRFLPTVYSFTQNRCAVVEGSDKPRLEASRVFAEVLKEAGVPHAYRRIGQKYVLADLVLPHLVEFKKYGIPPFTPLDLTEEQIASLHRAPPIEIIIKTFHGGTSKHRYLFMSDSAVRESHPLFSREMIRAEQPYPSPLVRFDWRNALTRERDPNLKPSEPSLVSLCEKWAAELGPAPEGESFQSRKLREQLAVHMDPRVERLPDEILPEPLASLFIDVERATCSARNTHHVLQRFLNSCDVVCNDICLFITQDGSTLYGEVSPDCGRFRHFDLGSLDKDVWRAGGSSSQVLDKWNELTRLVGEGFARQRLAYAVGPSVPLSSPPKIYMGTTNPYKLREIGSILWHLGLLLVPCSLRDVEEPYDNFVDNARVKAVAYSTECGGLTLGEDSGISVDALGGLPGPWSARFSDFAEVDKERGKLVGYISSGREREVIDRANNQRLMALMKEVPEGSRTARFEVAMVLARPDGSVAFTAQSSTHGRIPLEPKGEGGFGYDPVFVGDDTNDLTYAELDQFRKNLRSHRRRCLHLLADHLSSQLAMGLLGS